MHKYSVILGFGSHQMLLLMWSHHHHTRNVASGKMTWATTPERRLKECRLLWMPFASATAMSLSLDFESRGSIDKVHFRSLDCLAIWSFKTKEIWNRWLCVSLNIRWHLKLFLMFYKIWIASVDCISMYWNLWFNSQMSTLFTNLTTEMELFVQMAPH